MTGGMMQHGEHIPFAEYQARDGINATSLKAGSVSMLKMRHAMTHHSDPTPAMRMGSLIHSAVLEPADFFKTIAYFPGKDRRAAGYKAFVEDNEGMEVLVGDELSDLQALSLAVHANPHAHDLVNRSRHEVSLFWADPMYGAGKARLDGMEPGVVEFKTTRGDITTSGFERLAYNMGYHIQLGWYALGMQTVMGLPHLPQVHVIALKQSDDMDCRVFRASDGLLELGVTEAVRIAKEYHVAKLMGRYPGVSGEIELLDTPAWMRGGDVGEIDTSEGIMEAGEL